jgi:predicted TIM-barrel fold metal-dependent hydrolase
MRVIDGHINISATGDWFETGLDASLSRAQELLNRAGVKQAMLIAMPGVCHNSFFSEAGVDRSRYWCVGNVQLHQIESSLGQIQENRLDGVFIHPRAQQTSLSTILDTSLPGALQESNTPLIICGWTQSRTVPIAHLSPLMIDQLAKRYPNLRILLAHLGGHQYWDSFMVARSNENVYLDCSYFLNFFEGTSLESDFYASLARIDKKVIYGSDFPEVDPGAYLSRFLERAGQVENLDLDRILHGNIEDFMPRKLS